MKIISETIVKLDNGNKYEALRNSDPKRATCTLCDLYEKCQYITENNGGSVYGHCTSKSYDKGPLYKRYLKRISINEEYDNITEYEIKVLNLFSSVYCEKLCDSSLCNELNKVCPYSEFKDKLLKLWNG